MAETRRKTHVRRKRIPGLTDDKKREIITLWDMTGCDYDYVAERCMVQRADVLAVVLADTRRKAPQPSPAISGRVIEFRRTA